jgi:hypothetical protein
MEGAVSAPCWCTQYRPLAQDRDTKSIAALGVTTARLARDVLHDRHGAFADERYGHRVGAHAPRHATRRAACEAPCRLNTLGADVSANPEDV